MCLRFIQQRETERERAEVETSLNGDNTKRRRCKNGSLILKSRRENCWHSPEMCCFHQKLTYFMVQQSWRALVKGKLRRFSLQSPFTALHTTEYVKFFGYRESCEKSDKTEMEKIWGWKVKEVKMYQISVGLRLLLTQHIQLCSVSDSWVDNLDIRWR